MGNEGQDFDSKYSKGYDDVNSDHAQSSGTVRDIAGLVLIFIGICIACWVFFSVYRLINSPESIPVYKELVNDITKVKAEGKENLNIHVSGKVLSIVAVSILLFISGILSTSLISQGVNLMNLDALRLKRQITSLKDSFNSKLDSLKESQRR